MAAGWYYRKSGVFNDETIGPIVDEEFLQLAYDGKLKLGTFANHPTYTAAIRLYESRGFLRNGKTGTLPPPRQHITEHQRFLNLE